MKKYIFVVIVIIILSCNKSKKEEVAEKVVKKELRPFFDSDKIDHYYLNFSEEDFTKITSKNPTTTKEKEFSNLYMGHSG